MQLPPLGKPQWPCLLLLRGEIGTTGLGICPTLSLIPGSRFLGPTANSRTQAGVGSKGVCVCVCVRARALMCTRVLLSSALSFLSNLLGPLRQVSVTLENGHKSFKHPHYRPAPEQHLMMFKALFSHQILRSLFTNCFFYHHTAQLLFFWPLGQIHSPSSSRTISPFKTL